MMNYNEHDYDHLRNRYKDFFIDLVCGFDCGPGWYKLIEKLTEDINKIIKDENLDIVVTQIREKHGTLRFHLSQEPDEIRELILKAEKESYNICEMCGENGKLGGDWYYSVRCIACRK